MNRKKYSTRFFCPLCRQKEGKTRMLWLDESINLLRCDVHEGYMKQCNCRTKDLIVMDIITETELEKTQLEIEKLPLTTEEEAKRVVEDKIEQDLAEQLLLKWGEEDVIGFN